MGCGSDKGEQTSNAAAAAVNKQPHKEKQSSSSSTKAASPAPPPPPAAAANYRLCPVLSGPQLCDPHYVAISYFVPALYLCFCIPPFSWILSRRLDQDYAIQFAKKSVNITLALQIVQFGGGGGGGGVQQQMPLHLFPLPDKSKGTYPTTVFSSCHANMCSSTSTHSAS